MANVPDITGKWLLDLVSAQLGGYANALDAKDILKFLNEGKNQVWNILKVDRAKYFVRASQNTTSTDDNFFADLTTTDREFTLPKDFHQLLSVEVLNSGFEKTEFRKRDMNSEEFKDARRVATADGSASPRTQYLYDIIGKRTMILAQFPEIAFQLRLWYVRSLPDIDTNKIIDEILFPYTDAIAIFAAKRVMLSLQDRPMTREWRDEWKESVKAVEASAKIRDITGIKVVQDFQGFGLE